MKDKLTGNKKIKGQAALEMLIALGILALVTSAAIMLTFGSQSTSVGTDTNAEALLKASTELEEARASASQDFSLVNTTAGTYASGPLTYSLNLDVNQIDSFTKQVTSTVSWTSGGQTLSVALSTILTDFSNGGSACSPILVGNWKNPAHYDYKTQDLISAATGNHSNGLGISDVKIYKHRIYMAAYDTANNGDTLYIFDSTSDPTQMPAYRGSVDNAPGISAGINAIALGNKNNSIYVYAANSYGANFTTCVRGSNCAQLQVIDATNPTPVVVYNFKIPSVTGSAGQAIGKSVFYSNGYVYIGLAKTLAGSEFNVIDVGGGGAPASPTNPVWKGGYSVGAAVNGIFVKGNYAYIATPNSENLTILDISNPLSPAKVGGFTPGVGTNNGESVLVSSNNIYLGRTFGSNEFYILNNSTSSPSSLGSKDIGTGSQTTVNGIVVRDHLAFLLTNAQFQVWDITNPGSISPWSLDGTTNTFLALSAVGGNGSTAVSCAGNLFYTGITSTQGNNKDILSIIGPEVPNTYALSATNDITVTQGASGSNTITRTVTSGNPPGETLTISGLPSAGATASLSNNPCTPNCSGTLTITTSYPLTPAGTYPITVSSPTGVNTGFNLFVNPQPFDYTLSNSGPINVVQGGSGNNTITRTYVSGASTPVTLSVTSVLPAGVTANFTNNPCSPTCNSQLTITTSASTPAGSYTIIVTGSPNGTGPRTTNVTLNVTAAFDYSISAPSVTVVRAGSSVNQTIIISKTAGAAQSVTITPSAGSLPSGVTVSPASASCTPNTTCNLTFSYTASAGATTGAASVTVNGASPAHSTNFTLTVNAPPFTYTLPNNLPDLTLVRGGVSVPLAVTVTMAAGAVPQLVTLTPPNPASTDITIVPASASCTPSATSPYQCSQTFTYSAKASATKKNYNNQQVSGSPGSILSNNFKINVN